MSVSTRAFVITEGYLFMFFSVMKVFVKFFSFFSSVIKFDKFAHLCWDWIAILLSSRYTGISKGQQVSVGIVCTLQEQLKVQELVMTCSWRWVVLAAAVFGACILGTAVFGACTGSMYSWWLFLSPVVCGAWTGSRYSWWLFRMLQCLELVLGACVLEGCSECFSVWSLCWGHVFLMVVLNATVFGVCTRVCVDTVAVFGACICRQVVWATCTKKSKH